MPVRADGLAKTFNVNTWIDIFKSGFFRITRTCIDFIEGIPEEVKLAIGICVFILCLLIIYAAYKMRHEVYQLKHY